MSKKSVSLILVFVLITACFCQFAYAEETAKVRPYAELKFTEPDSDGFSVASLTIYNAFISGVQFGISFDKDVCQLADMETHEASSVFAKVRRLHDYETADGVHKFTEAEALCKALNDEGILEFGIYGMPSDVSDSGARVNMDSNGFTLYEFGFKFLKNEDPGFGFLDYASNIYPKEAILADGNEPIDFDFSFILPESFNKESNKVTVETLPKEKTLKQLRDERIEGTVILNIENYATVTNGLLKWIDADNKKVVPFIGSDDRTYVPLRYIGEAFGADVVWDAETREVKLSLDGATVVMTIGENTYTKNGEEFTMDAAPVIVEDRTFIPVRYVSEALNKAVYWDGALRLVIVTPAENPWNPQGEGEQSILTDAMLIMSSLVRDLIE